MDVFIQYAIAASQFAMDDCEAADHARERAERRRLHRRRASAGSAPSSASTRRCSNGGPRKISPFFIPSAIINLAAGQVSIRFGAKGPNLATCTACSASAHAIGESFEIIKRGDADAMIAGGSEAAITPMSVGGFARACARCRRATTSRQRASRPFDKDRDGFIIGEGAGVLDPRGAGARAARAARRSTPRSSATASSADAYHITAPSEDGDGARAA